MAKRTSTYAEAVPYWSDSASMPVFKKLDHDTEADVLDTGRTSAHLTMVTDTRFTDLEKRFGKAHAQAVFDAGLAAIAEIESIARDERIECDFQRVDGYLHAPNHQADESQLEELRGEAASVHGAGFDATFVDEVPFIGGPGVRFDHQARFHPRKYLAGVASAIRANGGEIYEHSAADEFAADPPRAKVNGHWVRAQDIVIATHNPLVGLATTAGSALFQTKLALYTSYVVAAKAPADAVPDALFWDTSDPYRYLRIEPHRDHDVVILGGEDHKTGQVSDTGPCYESLERALELNVPGCSVTNRWSGQVIETPDGLPYIGAMTGHQYAATGFSGNGLTTA